MAKREPGSNAPRFFQSQLASQEPSPENHSQLLSEISIVILINHIFNQWFYDWDSLRLCPLPLLLPQHPSCEVSPPIVLILGALNYEFEFQFPENVGMLRKKRKLSFKSYMFRFHMGVSLLSL